MNPKFFKSKSYIMILATNIRLLREHNKLSTKELAEEILGFPEEELINLEAGKYPKLNLERVVDIANFFKVSLDNLIKNDCLLGVSLDK